MTMHRQWARTVGMGVGLAVTLATAGCKNQTASAPAPIVDMNDGPDPAAANLATPNSDGTLPAGTATSAPAGRVLGARSAGAAPQAYGEQYPETQQQPYAAEGQAYSSGSGGQEYAYNDAVDAGEDALAADQPPPPLPVYQQPNLTVAGDEWTPGYWNYGTGGYYWVPGAWVAPPSTGLLWTPGYWGFYNRRYFWHRGYWGRHVGFYGGVPYGFGYTGYGYDGGYWNGNNFYYNQTVNRINVVDVRNVYIRRVNEPVGVRISFNGPGGIAARPQPAEVAMNREPHYAPAQAQLESQHQAQGNRAQFFSANHGQPAVVARPEHFAADRAATPIAGTQTAQMQGQGSHGTAPQQGRQPAQADRSQQGRSQQGTPMQQGLAQGAQRASAQQSAERGGSEQQRTQQQRSGLQPQQEQRGQPSTATAMQRTQQPQRSQQTQPATQRSQQTAQQPRQAEQQAQQQRPAQQRPAQQAAQQRSAAPAQQRQAPAAQPQRSAPAPPPARTEAAHPQPQAQHTAPAPQQHQAPAAGAPHGERPKR